MTDLKPPAESPAAESRARRGTATAAPGRRRAAPTGPVRLTPLDLLGLLTGPEDEHQSAEAVKACENKNPLPAPETDPQQNPNYAVDFRACVACMNDRGLSVKALPDGSGCNYDSSVSEEEKGSARAQKIIRDCEIEAFKQEASSVASATPWPA